MTEYHSVDVSQPELKELADAVADQPTDRYAHGTINTDLEGQRRYLQRYRELAADDRIQSRFSAFSHISERHALT